MGPVSEQTPGPSEYKGSTLRKGGGAFLPKPKSDLDLTILRSRETPGPNASERDVSSKDWWWALLNAYQRRR